MGSVLAVEDELKAQEQTLEHRHGFESVGAILRRLFQRKDELEACMTCEFDSGLSLDLDAVTDQIDAMGK